MNPVQRICSRRVIATVCVLVALAMTAPALVSGFVGSELQAAPGKPASGEPTPKQAPDQGVNGSPDQPARALEPGSAPGLTLAECYRLVIERSESDQIRAQDIKVAEARYRAALGGFVPELGLFASKVRNDTVEASRDPARNPANDAATGRVSTDASSYLFRRTPTYNPYFAGAFMRIPLFNGFRNYYETGALRHETERQRLLRKRERELLYLDLASVFYQILEYEKTAELLADEARSLESSVAELKRYVRLGRARRSEVLSAQADLAAARAQAQNLNGLLGVSRELLAFLVGRPARALALRSELSEPGNAELEALLRMSGERKDVLAAAMAVRAKRAAVRGARGGHLPSVSLDSSYYLSQSPDTGRDWQVSLRIELPIFSGGRTSASVSVADAELRTSELDLQRIKRSASHEVRSSYEEYTAWLAQGLLLQEASKLYTEAYEAQRVEVRYGVVRNLELLDSLRKRYQAERAALRARYASQLVRIRLHVAAGRIGD